MENASTYGVLRVEIHEDVPAFQLALFISLVDGTYQSHLFMDKVEREGIAPPRDWLPDATEALFVNRLQIGTPNFIEFFGLADSLIHSWNYLGGIVGITAAIGAPIALVKGYWSVRETRAKAKMAELEFKRAEAEGRLAQGSASTPEKDLDPYIRAVKNQQRLSKEQVDDKKFWNEYVKNRARLLEGFAQSSRIVLFRAESGVERKN